MLNVNEVKEKIKEEYEFANESLEAFEAVYNGKDITDKYNLIDLYEGLALDYNKVKYGIKSLEEDLSILPIIIFEGLPTEKTVKDRDKMVKLEMYDIKQELLQVEQIRDKLKAYMDILEFLISDVGDV